MAAPPGFGDRGRRTAQVTYPARAGNLILFESWLRHGVASNTASGERISISFNYNWV